MTPIEQLANTATNYIWGLKAPKILSAEQMASAKLVAHRGVHNSHVRENSRESFDLAVKNKIWGIEFDVRFTKDNVPVIHHDPHCKRLYNCDVIIELTEFAELKKMVPQIPTLHEVVENWGRKIHLLIEIKTPATKGATLSPQQEQVLQKTLSALTPVSDYHLLTLNADHLKTVTFVPPKAIMAVDWMDMENTIKKATVLKFGAVSGHFMLMNDARLAVCKAQGLITGSGFIETKGCLYREITRGIDWIFTNHPLRLKAYLA